MQLVLAAQPDAVPKARRFAAEVTRDLPDFQDGVELVVTELVTNAVLHAAGPVVLQLRTDGDAVRVEVTDGGGSFALTPRDLPMGMTGRGLGLVAAYAAAWGIAPADGGKTVWVELRPDPEDVAPIAAAVESDQSWAAELAADSAAESADGAAFEVRIPGVRADLVRAVRAHSDGLVRDLQLALGAGSFDRSTVEVVERLLDDLTLVVAEHRDETARQAAAVGDGTFTLVLRATADAVDKAHRHLDALDEADRFARSAQLLSPPASPVLRVFRRWLGEAVIDAVRARSQGHPSSATPTFESALAREVGRLAGMSDAAERLSALQRVTKALAHAHSLADIARAVTMEVVTEMGALSARAYLLRGDRLEVLAVEEAVSGWVPAFDEIPLDAELPAGEVVRTGTPLVLRGRAQLAERFPGLADVYSDDRALHIAPLIVDARCIGVLGLTFPLLGVDDATQNDFVATLADMLAQALDRALVIERLAETNAALGAANDRLTFLADASAALSGSLDFQETVGAIVNYMVPRLADWCFIQLLDEDGQLNTVALAHPDPARVAWAHDVARRYPTRMDADFGAANVIRTGRAELYAELPTALLEAAAEDDEHRVIIRELALSSALVVPLTVDGATLGVLTLTFAESGRRYAQADVAFAEDVARRAALALRSAVTFRAQTGRLAEVQRVADAAQRAILAPPPARLGPLALAARYVAAAAEAQVGGDFYEVVSGGSGARLLIGDVRGKGLAAVRTATLVLGEFRAARRDDSLPEVAARLDRRMRPYLADEDFVTALLADVHDDGRIDLVSCGHPPPLILTNGQIVELPVPADLPLGLGAVPEVMHSRLRVGDRLLLYTDGAIEARDSRRRFIELASVLQPGLEQDPAGLLETVVSGLHRRVGQERLGDDLALLVAEYRGTAPA